jgi:hypothetical protein
MKMKKLIVFLFGVSLIFGLAGVAQAVLVTNWDFETVDDSPALVDVGTRLSDLVQGSGPDSWDVFESIPGWQAGYNGGVDEGLGIEVQYNSINKERAPNRYVELDSEFVPNTNYSNSSMYQMIDVGTTPVSVEIIFDFASRTATLGDNGIIVMWDGAPAAVYEDDNTSWHTISLVQPGSYFGEHELVFTATGLNNELGGFLDNIRVETTAVPEPITILLLGSGLVGLLALRKRSRK